MIGPTAPAGGGDGGADGARLVLLVVSPLLVLFAVLVPLAIAALPPSPMCVYFDRSRPSRTRPPDIARRWNSRSGFRHG
jgi:hypothetical protein